MSPEPMKNNKKGINYCFSPRSLGTYYEMERQKDQKDKKGVTILSTTHTNTMADVKYHNKEVKKLTLIIDHHKNMRK